MEMTEVWKSVVRYEGVYEVSGLGRVRRIAAASGTRIGKILRAIRRKDGLVVALSSRGIVRWFRISRLIADAFLPKQPQTDSVVRHLNDNPFDNRLVNLSWGTMRDNTMDMMRNRHWKPPPMHRGEDQHLAVLNEELVREIRRLYAAGGTSYRKLGILFGVHYSVIGSIVRRESWKHVV